MDGPASFPNKVLTSYFSPQFAPPVSLSTSPQKSGKSFYHLSFLSNPTFNTSASLVGSTLSKCMQNGPSNPSIVPTQIQGTPTLARITASTQPSWRSFQHVASHKVPRVIRFHLDHVRPPLKTSQGLEDQHPGPSATPDTSSLQLQDPAGWTVPPKPLHGPSPLHWVSASVWLNYKDTPGPALPHPHAPGSASFFHCTDSPSYIFTPLFTICSPHQIEASREQGLGQFCPLGILNSETCACQFSIFGAMNK